MSCIYQRSKYYAKAKAEAQSIVEPIGYKFLNTEVKPKEIITKKKAQNIIKYTCEKPQTKQLSGRVIPFREVQRWLKVTQSSQRKNYNLSGPNLQFVTRNLNETTLTNLRRSFFSLWRDPEFISFIQLLSAMHILKDNMFSIRDYALSSYLVYYHGQNTYFYHYIQNAIKEQFIEYSNEILINCPQLSRPQLKKIDYQKKQQVQNYISEIMEIGREKDELFGGVHLYFSDLLPQKKQASSVILEQTEWWSFIQFQIAVATGVLNDGQHAIIKIGGTFTSKSIQYVFLLRLAFHRVYFHKSNMGNPFTNQKYIVCQFFSKENGRAISQYLLNNYDEILKGKESVNMVDTKAIYQNEFHMYINDFNNLSSMIKYTRQIFREFMESPVINFYPPKQTYIKKLQEFKMLSYQNQRALERLQFMVPFLQKKEEEKKLNLIQKQAVVFDFEAMSQHCRPAPKKNQSQFFDISQKKTDDTQIKQYIKRSEVVTKIVKEREKKKKQVIKEYMKAQTQQQPYLQQ